MHWDVQRVGWRVSGTVEHSVVRLAVVSELMSVAAMVGLWAVQSALTMADHWATWLAATMVVATVAS